MEANLSMGGGVSAKLIRAKGPGLLWKISNLPNVWRGLWRGWLSGGTAGETYTVTCQITTSAGRTDERSISVSVQSR